MTGTDYAAASGANGAYVTRTASAGADTAPDKVLKSSFTSQNNQISEAFSRFNTVTMGDPNEYSGMNGVVTFRGGPFRQNAAASFVTVTEGKLQPLKVIRTSRLGEDDETLTGFGFGAQPIIVKWYKDVRQMMNIDKELIGKSGLKEVIAPSTDGKVYFLDLDSMEATRPALNVGVPLSVTASVNPYGLPILYVGQSAEKVEGYEVNAGMRIYSLVNQKLLTFMTSLNTVAEGGNHGVRSSALLETNSDTLIYTDDNGMLYTIGLGTQFDPSTGNIMLNPSDAGYGYVTKLKQAKQGIPAGVSVYGNYAYFGDIAGSVQCIDMNTMQCVWARDVGDSVMAAISIEETANGVYLYTGNVVNKFQKSAVVSLYKLDALTGDLIWQYQTEYKGKYESKTAEKRMYAGLMASPIVGQGDISDLVIFNVNRLTVADKTNSAVLYALNKETGKPEWTEILDAESVSSPVAVYNETGTSFIIVGDDNGNLRMLDGYNGNTMDIVNLQTAIQASPAVYGNRIVVGTTGGSLYFLDIK